LQSARPGEEQDRLRSELAEQGRLREIVAKQSLLPLRRRSFLALCVVSLALLLLLPFSVRWFATSGNGEGAIKAAVCTVMGNPTRLQ